MNTFPSTFRGLQQLMVQLRAPSGCPWDIEQTSSSLMKYFLEETYELLDAIEENDPILIMEEIGDLIFNLVFHIQIAKEENHFNERSVFEAIIKKLIRRHPHVFSNMDLKKTDEVVENWQKIKKTERKNSSLSILDGIPKTLPALSQAQTLQQRASDMAFDWETITEVQEKIFEEIEELEDSIEQQDKEEEIGDILFSIVNLARWMKIDAEFALRKADKKFKKRFEIMENLAFKRKLEFKSLSMEDKNSLWEEAKSMHKNIHERIDLNKQPTDHY